MADSKDRRADKLNALLAQGRLGGPRRDQIFEGALAGAGLARRRKWLAFAFGGFATTALAAAVLLVVMKGDGFRARGGGGPVLEVSCVGATASTCPSGSTLMFRAARGAPSASERVFYHAWAEPAGGGERVWLFVGESAEALEPQAAAEVGAPVTLPNGVRVDASLRGSVRVHLLLARRALTRDDALHPPADAVVGRAETTLVIGP